MKKIWSTLILALLAVGVCLFCLFYVTAVSDEAENSVGRIETCVKNSNYDEAFEETKKLEEFWNYHHTMLSIIVHHSVLEKIEQSVILLKASIENKGEEDIDFWLESKRTLSELKNLRDVEVPSLGNIL